MSVAAAAAARLRDASIAAGLASAVLVAPLAAAQPTSRSAPHVDVDGTAVRFVASETGGPTRPRFITQRMLAFEARLEMMGEEGGTPTEPIDERHVHAAVEHHVAQELLGNIPHELPPKHEELARLVGELREALETRVGGREALVQAAAIEGISMTEVDETVWREAAAALYIDRSLTPVLRPSEEQLREAYRTASHPFRSLRYDEARAGLLRWFVLERVRVAEASFLQSGRSRVVIVYVARELATAGAAPR